MVSVAEADAVLAALVPPPSYETVGLEAAAGRRLGVPVVADRDGPPFDRVTMDGYAVARDDGPGPWKVGATQWAGQPPVVLPRPGAVEVATGAVVPPGADTILPYEDTERRDDVVRLLGVGWPRAPRIHAQGSDYRRGDVLVALGTVLRSPHLHALATCGLPRVDVVRRPRWALGATGDELVDPEATPEPWQIRRSNAVALAGEGAAWGLPPVRQAVAQDDAPGLSRVLGALADGVDAVVTTGGVSAGTKDLVPRVLRDLGFEPLFHGVAQRPGKPLWVGRRVADGRTTVVFGLPGNPVSSLVAFRRYVVPWLLAFDGRTDGRRPWTGGGALPTVPPGTTWFLPATGTKVLDWTGSGDFAQLGPSTGLVEWSGAGVPKYFPWGGEE